MSTLSSSQALAAQAFVEAAITALRTEQGVHAETAVAGTARMAGTFLFRSFAFPVEGIQPGQAILSDAANEQGPALIEILGAGLAQLGVPLRQEQLGTGPTPEHAPILGFLETQRLLEPPFERLRQRHALSRREAAEAAALATALLVQQTAQVLDPTLAFDLAVYGFIEGSKTAPDPVAR